jgi:hypothetical protein
VPGHASLDDFVEASGTGNVFAETFGRRIRRQRRPAQCGGAENGGNGDGFLLHEKPPEHTLPIRAERGPGTNKTVA